MDNAAVDDNKRHVHASTCACSELFGERSVEQGERLTKKQPLDPGDTIEFAVVLNHDYQTVRCGVTITVREGETAAQAQDRAEKFVWEQAERGLEDLGG